MVREITGPPAEEQIVDEFLQSEPQTTLPQERSDSEQHCNRQKADGNQVQACSFRGELDVAGWLDRVERRRLTGNVSLSRSMSARR